MIKAVLIFLIGALAMVSAGLDKIPHWPGFGFNLQNYYKPIGYKLTPIKDATGCDVNQCKSGGLANIYNAVYADGNSVKICICKNAVSDVSYIAKQYSYVPVWMRKYTSYLTSASNGACGGAYSTGLITTYCQPNLPVEVFVHEATHHYDGQNVPGGHSPRQTWKDAIKADTCVPDGYANSSEAEDMAQIAVTWMYVEATGNEPSCMHNQMRAWRKIIGKSSPGQRRK